MGESTGHLDRHWQDFAALQEDYRQQRILLGIDRGFARMWVLRGGKGCPPAARTVSCALIVLVLVGFLGGLFIAVRGEYLLAAFLFLMVFLSWRLFVHLAIGFARSAAMRDEDLFREWFDALRLSIFVKSTGEYVWNEPPAAPS